MRVPERPLVSLQRNTKLYSCTQTVIRFFTAKYEILKLYPNGLRLFYSEIQNFENYTQTVIRSLTKKYAIFRVIPKWPFVSPTKK